MLSKTATRLTNRGLFTRHRLSFGRARRANSILREEVGEAVSDLDTLRRRHASNRLEDQRRGSGVPLDARLILDNARPPAALSPEHHDDHENAFIVRGGPARWTVPRTTD